MKYRSLLLPLLFALTACGGGASGEAPKPQPTASAPVEDAPLYVLPADYDIASKVYDTTYSVPAGFFVDERASTARSYTIHHVMDESRDFEVCTDDFAAAEALEAADNEARAVKGQFISSHETERYFEFVRELAYTEDVGGVSDPTSPGYARIFKCSNTSRDGVDRSRFDGYAGQLNRAPRSQQDVRIFAEYLWQFAFFPYRNKKVLDSVQHADATALGQTLILGFAINQGAGRCNRIEVVEWAFAADRATGRVEQRFDLVHSFEARYESGTAVVCD